MISESLIALIKALLMMAVIGLILYSMYLYIISRRGLRAVGEKLKVYACGEDYPAEKASVSHLNLYWGAVKKVFKSAYLYIRDKMHTGILSDWYFYMTILVISLIIILGITFFIR